MTPPLPQKGLVAAGERGTGLFPYGHCTHFTILQVSEAAFSKQRRPGKQAAPELETRARCWEQMCQAWGRGVEGWLPGALSARSRGCLHMFCRTASSHPSHTGFILRGGVGVGGSLKARRGFQAPSPSPVLLRAASSAPPAWC